MNPGVLIAVGTGGFILFAIIFVVGFRLMRDEQDAKAENKTSDAKRLAPPSPIPLLPPPMATNPENAHEVLRVLRDNLTGRLVVEIAGRRYERIQDIRDANIGRGFVMTLRDLQKFLTGSQSATGSLPPIPLPAPQPAPQPQRPAGPPLTTSSQQPAASRAQLPEMERKGQPLAATFGQPAATGNPPPAPNPQSSSPSPAPAHPTLSELPPIQKPSMNPFKQAKVLRELEKLQGPPPKSIPEQIDEILQEKMARTPHRGRGCRVYLGPKGNVIFDLDGKSYEGVDEVPDPEVRTIIRAAVAEWEKKQ